MLDVSQSPPLSATTGHHLPAPTGKPYTRHSLLAHGLLTKNTPPVDSRVTLGDETANEIQDRLTAAPTAAQGMKDIRIVAGI